MSDFFMRDDAPLSAEEWERLDKTVVHAARQFLVGRQFIELAGPFGADTEVIPVGTGATRKFLQMETIQADFSLAWRDIEASRQLGVPIELGVHAGPGSIGVAYYAENQPSTSMPSMEKLGEYARDAKNALLSRVPWTQKSAEDENSDQ